MKKLHELHCNDGAGTVDIKKCKQHIATLARPTYTHDELGIWLYSLYSTDAKEDKTIAQINGF